MDLHVYAVYTGWCLLYILAVVVLAVRVVVVDSTNVWLHNCFQFDKLNVIRHVCRAHLHCRHIQHAAIAPNIYIQYMYIYVYAYKWTI